MEPANANRTAIFALFAIVLGFGILWAGSQGIQLALHTQNQANIITPKFVPVQEVKVTPAKIESAAVVNSQVASSNNSVDIMMAGDVMFDRGIRKLGQRGSYDSLLASVAPLF